MSSTSPTLWKGLALLSLVANGLLLYRTLAPLERVETEPPLRPDLAPFAELGSFVAENNQIPRLKWTSDQFAAFQRGFSASYQNNGYAMTPGGEALRKTVEGQVQALVGGGGDAVEAYFAELRAKENVSRTDSGLHYRIIDAGFGDAPDAEATVVVSLAARLPDGTKLPQLSSVRLRTPLSALLPGLVEGCQLLKPGGRALLYLPASLSFGSETWPASVAPGTPITFLFELHEIAL